MALESPRLHKEAVALENAMQELLKEIHLDYARAENKITFNRYFKEMMHARARDDQSVARQCRETDDSWMYM